MVPHAAGSEAAPEVPGLVRERDWPGAFNARDLGGVALAGGATTASGVLFRSGRVTSMPAAGWDALRRDGVRTIVDLRNGDERARRPDDPPLPDDAMAGVRIRHAPTEDPGDEVYRRACVPYLNTPRDYGLYATRFADRIARALDAIADAAADGAVLVHCSAGRDRTGLVLALALRAAGAPPEAIAHEDELATRAVNAHHGRRTVRHPYERFQEEAALAVVIAERRAALLAWLAELDAGGESAAALASAGALRAAERVAVVLGVCGRVHAAAPRQ